ncbi:F-box/LRR-repeat protein 2 [Frankliniella fusca]|uniref:F-box/LRR-repeat protein 2 n=1 Tax=Frankliniella fusca TaxID=407009 RepID=A0AAE1LUA3_9NEOP|nr:F-box/LRR-repeat protein 2 [Frankliniella fusca]
MSSSSHSVRSTCRAMGSAGSAERRRRPGDTRVRSPGAGAENVVDRRVGDRQASSARPAGPGEEPEPVPEPVPWVARLPPELLLRVLALLDVPSLCAASHALHGLGLALDGALRDASLWRRASLTLCSPPWPPRPPAALRVLRVCSYRWRSAAHARTQLTWLGSGLGLGPGPGPGPGLRVQRLELVGRNLDDDTVRACLRLCAGPALRELSLHDVLVRDSWLADLASLTQVEALHLDWHTEMSAEQMLSLTAACPTLQLIDSGGSPQDSSSGRSLASLKSTMKLSNANLKLTVA